MEYFLPDVLKDFEQKYEGLLKDIKSYDVIFAHTCSGLALLTYADRPLYQWGYVQESSKEQLPAALSINVALLHAFVQGWSVGGCSYKEFYNLIIKEIVR